MPPFVATWKSISDNLVQIPLFRISDCKLASYTQSLGCLEPRPGLLHLALKDYTLKSQRSFWCTIVAEIITELIRFEGEICRCNGT